MIGGAWWMIDHSEDAHRPDDAPGESGELSPSAVDRLLFAEMQRPPWAAELDQQKREARREEAR
jgi:hypothetical protein